MGLHPPSIAERVFYRVAVENESTGHRRELVVELGQNEKLKMLINPHCWPCVANAAAMGKAEQEAGPGYIAYGAPQRVREFEIVH